MRSCSVIFAVALLPGCAASPPPLVAGRPSGPDPALLARAISQAAEQVRPCYRSPKLNRIARQIVTVLNVHYTADGMLAAAPVVARQSGVNDENRMYASTMARAAADAVIRCVPVHLPPELYSNGWDEIDLTFSPRGLA